MADATRIKDLTETTTLSPDMNLAVDNASGGTKRIQLSTLIDENLTTAGKAADAAAVGELKSAIMELEQEGYPIVSIEAAVDAWAQENEEEIVNGYVTPEMFGAVGNGVNDDTAAVQAALTSSNTVVLRGKYAINIETHIAPKSGNVILFDGGELFALPASQVSTNQYFEPIIDIINVDNVTIKGQGCINGNRNNQPTEAGKTNEWASGIRITNSNNIHISGIRLIDCHGDGIEIYRYNTNIFIDNILCNNNYRQGLTIGGVSGCVVTNSIFRNTNGTAPEAGITIEVEANYYAENVTIDNCAFFNNVYGIQVASKTSAISGYTIKNVAISNCTALNNSDAGYRIECKDGCAISNCVAQGTAYGFWVRQSDGIIISGSIAKELSSIGVYIQQSSFVKINGMMIFDNAERGVYIAQGCDNIELCDCTIYGNSGAGINIYGADSSFKNTNIKVQRCNIFDNRSGASYLQSIGEIHVTGQAENILVMECIINKTNERTGYAIYFESNTYGFAIKNIVATFADGAIYNVYKSQGNIIDNLFSQGTMEVYYLSSSSPSTVRSLIKSYEPNGTTKHFAVYWSSTSTTDGLVSQSNLAGRVTKIVNNQYILDCMDAEGRRYHATSGSTWAQG